MPAFSWHERLRGYLFILAFIVVYFLVGAWEQGAF